MTTENEPDFERLALIASITKPIIVAAGAASLLAALVSALWLNGQWPDYSIIAWGLGSFEFIVLGSIALLVASYIAVSFWLYRAHTNLLASEMPGAITTGGWAIAWYAIPIANLFKPFQSMKELWTGSVDGMIDANETASGLLWAWWLTWLFGSLGGFGADYGWLDVAVFISTAISAGLLFIIVDRITKAQPSMSVTSTFE
ncbi:DUF4328 domain-containing protein [Erythrobacter sp. F6033]|uniref:DUF4328 domain-containing protein n=1 Tax=Erythrobacter sp. F6033 TaxID=2926401 RepID=UPI001FF12AF4|nr:DUF4328 domain-containing protein [Erythrobacter sp. F6033]MCK0127859.1 DUF4328 domain-containing protein [Erythrobacter sp. F6033]